MTNSKRDNEYWHGRLKKDGHHDLLAEIEAGKISTFVARAKAGYRKAGPRSPAETLSHHWIRANSDQREKFVLQHASEINRVLHEVREKLVALRKARNPQS
ncbi:hypothetical protein M2338_001681 [Sphingobium sp. B2D3B]|nr:hypothetical protein [Sphingobium sp. B2D3B]